MMLSKNSLLAGVSVILFGGAALHLQAQPNPTWLGRPFVKVIKQGDPIPGTTSGVFTELTAFTLRDGVLHIVAGQGSNQKGLFRWQNGGLTNLVYTNTVAPTGDKFNTVHFTTDESGGAVNFVGEVFFGNPGFVYGLFRLTNGNISTVFDTANSYGGIGFFGFGYPVRASNAVVWSSQFITNGIVQNGIFKWDGVTLQTVVNGSTELPGSLGLYAGSPGSYQLAFDGQNIGFIGTDGNTASRTNGIYRADVNGALTKLIDGNDIYPGTPIRTYHQRNVRFTTANVDVSGTNSFYDRSSLISAAGGTAFYSTDGFRYTGGTFNSATATFGTDGLSEWVLQPFEQDYVTPTLLDGQAWDRIDLVDGQGDDVAYKVHFADGTFGLYATIGPAVTPVNLTLVSPVVTNGLFQFQFPTTVGPSYRVDFKSALTNADWTPRTIIAGGGTNVVFSEPTTNANGFFRVTVLP